MIQRRSRVTLSLYFFALTSHAQTNNSVSSVSDAGKPSVQIYATVSMKDGSAATLDSSALKISIDKQLAQVTAVRSAKDDKLLFAVVVDISSSELAKAQLIKDAAVRLFEGLATGDNQGYLVLINQVVMPSKRALQPSEVQMALERIKFGGGTALFDAIGQTCTQILSRSKNPEISRRVMILLSDGGDNQSHISDIGAVDLAQREGVMIFALTDLLASSREEMVLKELTSYTGGKAVFVNKLPDGTNPLLAAIHEQWVVSIVPLQAPDQKLHSLIAKPSQKDVLLSVPAHILLP